ncbi:Na+/H+ antiporter subunit G [Pontitalea aquivivens]|uniref:Na+/H+ antiporter subunit G n=1 Tax=Pontitalea aquivivens TaxID=3388663 RepID=UPI0039710294
MEIFWEILISALLVIAGIFGLVGSYGLVKLPDPMTRLHAPTKATTVGVGSVLIASMLYFGAIQRDLTLHELMITLFLFLTAPITAHFIAKANLYRDWNREQLPRPEGEAEWALYQEQSDTSAEELRENAR